MGLLAKPPISVKFPWPPSWIAVANSTHRKLEVVEDETTLRAQFVGPDIVLRGGLAIYHI